MNTTTIDLPKTGASNNRFRSKQDYETPWELIWAINKRFGALDCDLAADPFKAKAKCWIEESKDSLKQDWLIYTGTCFLNPPFNLITPWAEKCAREASRGCKILFLTPASVDSNWWANYVHGKAWVEFLSPRISFD